MEKHLIKPRQGIILISEPSLQDFWFRQSVVLLAEHNKEGSFGVIINKPMESTLGDVVKEFTGFDFPVFLGGPVKTDSIFFLHTKAGVANSLPVMEGLYWGGDIDIIREMMRDGEITRDDIRFYVGYSGWHPHQLDREIEEKSWVLSHTTAREMIHADPGSLWSRFIRNMGKDYAIWANFPSDPSMN